MVERPGFPALQLKHEDVVIVGVGLEALVALGREIEVGANGVLKAGFKLLNEERDARVAQMQRCDDNGGPVVPGLADVACVGAAARTVDGAFGQSVEPGAGEDNLRAVLAEGNEILDPFGSKEILGPASVLNEKRTLLPIVGEKNNSTVVANRARPLRAENRVLEVSSKGIFHLSHYF